jgi:hypothetical protein
MKNALANDPSHEFYVVELDGIAKFECRVFVKALSAGSQLKQEFPTNTVKLLDADWPAPGLDDTRSRNPPASRTRWGMGWANKGSAADLPQRTNHGLEVARCIGGRHGTPRTSPFGAFYFLGALPRGLDLGTPPSGRLSDKRR